MREFNTKEAEGDYSITFETDDRKAFERVQTLCRILVDGKGGEAIPIEQLLSILPKYDDYIHTKTYPYNNTIEKIYSEGHEEGWNACLKAIKEELDYWEKENESESE